MSSLTLFNSSGSMPFLVLTAVFLLVSPVIFMGFTTSQTDELSARVTKIVNELETRNNTSEIEKTFIEINKKITAHISEVNVNSTAEIRMKSIPTLQQN